jgi:flavin-dependent dehydrogenase
MQEHNIVIIGGGPSGLSTALHIARDFPNLVSPEASRILILEKAHYPRPKLCAGGLVIDAEVILQRLGLDVSEVPHIDAEKICFAYEANGLNIRVPRRHALRIIRRDEFDTWLAKKAESKGIEIREGITVKKILPENDSVILETDQGELRAQIIVGADGSNGITRRCIFPNAPVHTARVLEVLTPLQPPRAPANAQEVQRPQSTQAHFEFFPVTKNIAGYVWDFPTQVNGQVMHCWGIYDTNILADEKRPQLKEPLAKEMSRFGFNLDDYEIKGHPIRWFSPENQMAIPRVLLVGDSAGADPFLGEGISVALGYGALAAREIGEAFAKGNFSFKNYKYRVLRSPLGQALIIRWLLTHVVYPLKWKWFQVLIWRLLKPITVLFAWIFVLNWGKRMQSTL